MRTAMPSLPAKKTDVGPSALPVTKITVSKSISKLLLLLSVASCCHIYSSHICSKELSRNNSQIVRRIFLRECKLLRNWHKIRRIAGYVTDFALVLSEKKTRNIASYFGIVPNFANSIT